MNPVFNIHEVDAKKEVKEEVKIPELNYPRLIDRNKSWARKLFWNSVQLSKWLEIPIEPQIDEDIVDAIYRFQREHSLSADGICGPNTLDEMLKVFLSERDYEVRKVVMPTIKHESKGRFDSVNRDGEFRGLFDKTWKRRTGRKHPASGKIHIGISIGLLQATQDGGAAGEMLATFRKHNQELFDSIIGETAEELIEMLLTPGESGLKSKKLRGPRVQKVRIIVDGEEKQLDLWEDEWVDRIKRVLREPDFMDLQIKYFEKEYLSKKNIRFMKSQGLVSEKAVSACFDRFIHKGGGGGRSFIRNALKERGKEKATQLEKIRVLKEEDLTGRFKSRILDDDLTFDRWKGFDLI